MTTETQQTQLEENYEFPVEVADQAPAPPEPTAEVAPVVAEEGPNHLDILLKSKLTIVIQLFPVPSDGHAGGRPGLLGVQLGKNPPSIVSLAAYELTPLPDAVWKLADAQAAIIAAKAGGKPTPAPKAEKPKAQAAPAPKAKAAAPVVQRQETKPAPAPAQADMDDIYNLFDL